MGKRFCRWEIALIAGVLVGLLNGGTEGRVPVPVCQLSPQVCRLARYQVSVFPFAVGQLGQAGEDLPVQEKGEIQIRYFFPELWKAIRETLEGPF